MLFQAADISNKFKKSASVKVDFVTKDTKK